MKKFTSNDLFYNTLLASPKFTIVMQSGSLRINDQINQKYEYSSSISAVELTGTYTYKTYTGSYSYTSSISRDFIYSQKILAGDTFDSKYTSYFSLQKVLTLKNVLKDYSLENPYADISYYLEGDGYPNNKRPGNDTSYGLSTSLTTSSRISYYIRPTSSINLIQIPRDFYGSYIKPGTVQLNMYVSGVLTASALDTNSTGKLVQTYGGTIGNVIGTVLYDHGFIILTGSEALSDGQAPYIQPLPSYTASALTVTDYLKWIYFGSYLSTTGSAPETKYELIFQGTNYIPTLTMMCHAEKNELYWSNNRTFIDAEENADIFYGQATSSTDVTGSNYLAPSGSFFVPSMKVFQENRSVLIKNTISSSFVHYSASYEPQVFISQIGIYDEQKNLIAIAKLANPVRKTKDLDYTFKLKLDM